MILSSGKDYGVRFIAPAAAAATERKQRFAKAAGGEFYGNLSEFRQATGSWMLAAGRDLWALC